MFSWCSVRIVPSVDAFVERDELHVLLLLHHLENPRVDFLNDTTICCMQEIHLNYIMIGRLKVKGWEKVCQ